ncbi:unnamed protein product [Tetraodon nigroviridis]|uniref:(spotted green pufferfish) hypothetical protein n=1 Tax=Tetraodon nigroviridis TaxID=99883 RepID=Q4S7P2_TETNG|nr:unnamed protein product [Tetraodon nigroviridis]
MFVRVKRAIFKVNTAVQNLKLGTCTVNKVTDTHYYFLYPLTANCGFQTLSAVDDFTVKISLRYGTDGPVIRDVPFNVNIQCNYPRFFHSFKVGIHPKLEGGTVHKLLKQCIYTLRAKDENGNELTGSETIPIGSVLYFEARQLVGTGSGASGRFYIINCFLTTSSDPSSEPKYYVIDKGGCMMDSMASEQSKFLPTDSKSVLKFSMPTIMLDDSLSLSSAVEQKLFMHCETAAGPEKATAVYKACNYDMQEEKWKELYDDDDSVCSCCGSTCDTQQFKSSNKNVVSSRAWKVNWGKDKDEDINFSLEDQVYVVMDP